MSCDIGQPQCQKCAKGQKIMTFFSHIQKDFLSFCTLTLWLTNVTKVLPKTIGENFVITNKKKYFM